jgi:hypothetical protein
MRALASLSFIFASTLANTEIRSGANNLSVLPEVQDPKLIYCIYVLQQIIFLQVLHIMVEQGLLTQEESLRNRRIFASF